MKRCSLERVLSAVPWLVGSGVCMQSLRPPALSAHSVSTVCVALRGVALQARAVSVFKGFHCRETVALTQTQRLGACRSERLGAEEARSSEGTLPPGQGRSRRERPSELGRHNQLGAIWVRRPTTDRTEETVRSDPPCSTPSAPRPRLMEPPLSIWDTVTHHAETRDTVTATHVLAPEVSSLMSHTPLLPICWLVPMQTGRTEGQHERLMV